MIQISNVFDELKKLFQASNLLGLFLFFLIFDINLGQLYKLRLIELKISDIDSKLPIGGFFSLFIFTAILYVFFFYIRLILHEFFGRILLNLFWGKNLEIYASESNFLNYCIEKNNQIAYEEYNKFRTSKQEFISNIVDTSVLGIVLFSLYFFPFSSIEFIVKNILKIDMFYVLPLGLILFLSSYFQLSKMPLGFYALDKDFVKNLQKSNKLP
jgi:hypothetical protein